MVVTGYTIDVSKKQERRGCAMFFKRMTKKESANSKRAAGAGFFAYMLVTAGNYFYYISMEQTLLSPALIFWSGLMVFFVYDIVLNIKEKRIAG